MQMNAGGIVVKNMPANSGDVRDMGSIPGLGRSTGGGHDYSFQHSCLENSRDRRAWQATIHGYTKSRTRLILISIHTHMNE